jgi:ParB-like chromosome segregation protein Spo0J
VIVGGVLRYQIRREMGVETVPCRLANEPVDFQGEA